jgi:hypothetical protein
MITVSAVSSVKRYLCIEWSAAVPRSKRGPVVYLTCDGMATTPSFSCDI